MLPPLKHQDFLPESHGHNLALPLLCLQNFLHKVSSDETVLGVRLDL